MDTMLNKLQGLENAVLANEMALREVVESLDTYIKVLIKDLKDLQ